MEDDGKNETYPQGMKEQEEPEWMKYEKMELKEKRKLYKCGENFVMLKDIDTWAEYCKIHPRVTKLDKSVFPFNKEVNNKVSLWVGDITTLEIDAIVNAANESLLGGGGVDGCIHRAAGPSLKKECRLLNGCETGLAKISLGHKLPAKYILHTVGPIGEQEKKLESCYKSCLELCLKHGVRSVAFCCISTGIFGYPNKRAAEVAIRTTRKWLEENKDAIDRIIFCLFMDVDIEIYHSLMLKYYPPTPPSQDSRKNDQTEESDQQATNNSENTPEDPSENILENKSKKLKQDNDQETGSSQEMNNTSVDQTVASETTQEKSNEVEEAKESSDGKSAETTDMDCQPSHK